MGVGYVQWTAAAITPSPSPLISITCDEIWDGIDFTPCFTDRYIRNLPFLLIAISLIFILVQHALSRKHRLDSKTITPKTLVSPTADSDLSNLESIVILDTVASNLLPPSPYTSTTSKLGSGEAENVINQFKESEPFSVIRWRRIKFWVGLIGGIIWFEVELARAVVNGDWRNVALPAWAVLLSLIPGAPLTPLLSCHILPNILSLRSAIITHDRSMLRIVAHVVELAYWVALISIPYSEKLDRLLDGAVSHGGGSLGSYGEKLKKHYEEPTSPFSRATYTFLLPLLFKHYYTPITLKDIPAIREDDSAASSLGAFRAYQAKRDEIYAKSHKAKRNRHLGRDLLKFFAPELIAQAAWSILFICFQYLPPTGLRLLLQYVKDRETSQQPAHVAVLYVGMMVAGQVIGVVAMGQSLFIGRRLCIRMRAIIISDVFTKALRRRDLSGHIKKTTVGKDGKVVESESEAATEGKIANLVSVDAFTISEICAYIYYLVSCPLAILINSILLYRTLGLAAFAGIAMTVALFPVQGYIARLYTLYQRRFMAATDARLENVTEVISHIKLIKFNAWETKFFERMGESRRKELSVLAHRFAMTTLFQVVVWGTPVLVTGVAFAVHSLVLHEPLTADRAFASLILFNMLKDPLALFQDTLTRLLQAWTSCTRIQSYLDEPDTLKYRQLSVPGPDDPQVGFKGAVLGYALPEDAKDEEGDPFILGELDLSFPVGQLSIVCGPVGCGKSTLVLGLLGETMLLSGKVYMPDDHANREVCPIDPATGLSDTIAYCSQTPWLVGASIRENIVFGSEWNKTRYNRIVDACALRRDFEIFELGDETEVGEKGTTCSGGQKARIALARAFYSSAKTIILDDVLSAVDAQTARHLYNHILQGPLVKGRTVVMVTHQIHLVAPAASYVVMLEDGHVKAEGSPSQLKADGLLDHNDDDSNSGSTTPTATGSSSSNEVGAKDMIEEQLDGSEGDALEVQKQVEADKAADTTEEVKLSKQLVMAEQSGTGMVGSSTYLLYFKSMGKTGFWLLVLTAFFGSQFLQVASNAWIKEWANSNSSIKDGKTQRQERSTMFYLVVYWGISACYLVAVAARVGITFFGAISASKSLYDRLAKRILGAKMRFFDSTPSGRIMNRLSKDMSSIDQEAGEILMYFANCILSVIAVLAVVVFSTPVFLFTLVIIAVLYWIVGSLYVTTNREIKRIDSVTRSPIFISFSEVLVGMSTIRSYGDSARFTRKLLHELDQNTRCFWYLWQINRVLNNFSNFVGALVTIFAAVFALRNKDMDAGAVGLSVTYALSFTEYVLWVVRLYAASEMSMNSVERVGEYLELEVEEEETKKGIDPPAYWPTRDGSVVVENLTARYAPQLEPVLRDVSFTIGPKEKIGICGRTGSGKSTLALSFFRFLHQDGGSITIDGLDISKLSLTALRSRLTILPQEAQLFSGSVRDNLDPFDQHEDAEIWDALSLCGLVAKSRHPSRAQSRVDLSALSPSPSPSPFSTPGATPVKAKYNRTLGVDTQENSEPSTPVKRVHKLPSMKSLQKKLAAKNKGVEDGKGEEGGEGDEEEEEEEEERVMIKSLEEKVAVGGKNFSQGQRQLLALARGLLKLKTSSFLIMDESTANLDHETDKTIQNVLRNGLKDIQMLVIAHRLMTVCGLDKILVLDHGKVVEFGTPYDLLQKESGSFKDLCKQSGEEAQLLELAKNVHEAKMASGDQE